MHLLKQAFIYPLFLACIWPMQVSANELTQVEQKATVCFSCHGDKGKSTDTQTPSLAAQQSVYTVNQLKAFKSGSRVNAAMQAQTATMSDEDINNYGAYFTVQQPAKAGGDPALVDLGKSKATICMGCHGSSGEGNGQFPRLGGQHPEYLALQLTRFKSSERQNGAMQAIAGNLSDEDIKALAAFFGSL